jgi:hypothetical protein
MRSWFLVREGFVYGYVEVEEEAGKSWQRSVMESLQVQLRDRSKETRPV